MEHKRIKMFSESRIGLSREIKHHPELVALLQNHPPNELEVRLAEIAAYVGIMLDGDYVEQDLDDVCEMCRHKLWELRSPIRLPTQKEIAASQDSRGRPRTSERNRILGIKQSHLGVH